MDPRSPIVAVALEYDPSVNDAPLVSICSEGADAALVVRLARHYGVPVIEKPSMARSLIFLQEGSSVPSELFRAVALLLNHIETLLIPPNRRP